MLPATFATADGRPCRLVDDRARKGGQAVVYRAELAGRAVAVKVYHSGFERAETERRLLGSIAREDPTAEEWLVTVLAEGRVGDRPFLVLPWMDTTLTEWIPGRSLSERVAVLLDATRAVGRLHARHGGGYRVHRDIKPDNLLVNWEGRWVVRLADLGAAKGGDTRADTTNTGVRTQRFAPPEQALPVNQEPSESWDVHALAVTVFWGLTERIPIPALDGPSLLNAEGRELERLAQRVAHGSMNTAERARFDTLRSRRASELLDLDGAEGWREDDTAHLRRALDDAGVDEEVRERLLGVLIPALAGALHPDGERRDPDVRRLAEALVAWAEALPTEEGEPAAVLATPRAERVPVSVPSVAPRLPEVSSPSPHRWRLAASLAVGVSLGLAGSWAIRAGSSSPAAPVTTVSSTEVPVVAAPPASAPASPTASVPEPTDPPPSADTLQVSSRPARARDASRRSGRAPVADVPAPTGAPTSESAPIRSADGGIAAPAEQAPESVEAAPAPVAIRVRACPTEGATVSVDGGAPLPIAGLGVKVLLSPGPHTFAWTLGGDRHERTVAIDRARGVCHAFTVDRACGRCED